MNKALASLFALALFAVGATAHGQTIPAAAAIERALEATGGGTVRSLELVHDPVAGQVYQIAIERNALRFDVTVNAGTGAVARLSAGDVAPAPRAAAPGQAPARTDGVVIGNVVPRRPARPGGPANPPISAQRAVEIARDHLISVGVTRARFDYVYMDLERGRWVWSVEFDGGRGRDYEFYIDAHTGAILKFSAD